MPAADRLRVPSAGASPHRRHHRFHLDPTRPSRGVDIEPAGPEGAGPGVEQHLDAERRHASRDRRAEVRGQFGQHPVRRFDHADAGAELGERDADLYPDVAGPDDAEGRGQGVELEQRAGIEHPLAVEGQAGKLDGRGPRGDDEIAERNEAHPVAGLGDDRGSLVDQ